MQWQYIACNNVVYSSGKELYSPLTENDVEVEVLDNDNHVSGEGPNDDEVQEPLQHYYLQSKNEKA